MFKHVSANIFFILIIALQSLNAIADAPDIHQIDINHLKTEHSHSNDINISAESSNIDEHSTKDCHHCGHCSGSHLSCILIKSLYSDINLMTFEKVTFPYYTQQEYLETTIRPPIA